MLRAERQAKILQMVRDRGFIQNDELMALFDTSHVTIRRDLINLADQGLIKLEHGGATSINYLEGMPEPLYETKLYFRSEEKKAIAIQAMTFIKDGDILLLDSGTTNFKLASILKTSRLNKITVITSDLMVARELSPHPQITTIILGGIVRRSFYNTYGPYTEIILDNLKANKFFLGFDGATIHRGPSNTVLEEVPIKQKMISISDETIVLADATKFGMDAPYAICGWEKIQRVITDSSLSIEYKEFFRDKGIELSMATL